MSVDKVKNPPNLTPMESANPALPQAPADGPDPFIASANTAQFRLLAEDLLRTHGSKFASLFGASLLDAQGKRLEELKRRKAEAFSRKGLQRVFVGTASEMRALVQETIDPIYQNPEVIDGLTDYLCQHYELFYDVELKS